MPRQERTKSGTGIYHVKMITEPSPGQSQGDFWLMKKTEKGQYRKTNVKYDIYHNNNSMASRVLLALREMENSDDSEIKNVVSYLAYDKNSENHYISRRTRGHGSKVSVDEGLHYTFIDFDYDKTLSDFDHIGLTDFEDMTHEAQHMYDYDKGIVSSNPDKSQEIDGVDLGEIRAVRLENRARRLHHRKIRTIYDGKKINKKYL